MDMAAFPFEQAADFPFEAAAGDVGFAADGVFDDGVIDAADVDFAVARADVQAGFEDEVGGDVVDVFELHGGAPYLLSWALRKPSMAS